MKKNVSHACVPKPVGRVCPQASIYLSSYTPCMYPQSRPVRKFVALLHMFHLSLRCHVMQHGRTIRGRWLVGRLEGLGDHVCHVSIEELLNQITYIDPCIC